MITRLNLPRIIVILILVLLAYVKAEYGLEDYSAYTSSIDRIDKEFSELTLAEISANLDDASFGLRISNKRNSPFKRGLISTQSASPVQPVSAQQQSIIFTSPSVHKKEPSVHSYFGLQRKNKDAVKSQTPIEKETFSQSALGELPTSSPTPIFESVTSSTDVQQPYSLVVNEPIPVGPKPPKSTDDQQLEKNRWLHYLVERDVPNQNYDRLAENAFNPRSSAAKQEIIQPGLFQKSSFSLPPYGAPNNFNIQHQFAFNQDHTPTTSPSTVTSFQSPPTPGLSYSYLVLGSSQAPNEFLPKQQFPSSFPAQNSVSNQDNKLPPLPLKPLAFRAPSNVETSQTIGNPQQPVISTTPVVLNLKGETWGQSFKFFESNNPLPETITSEKQSNVETTKRPKPYRGFPSFNQQLNRQTSNAENSGFYIPPSPFRANNALLTFSNEPIQPTFQLTSFPTSQAFAEPSTFTPFSNVQESLWREPLSSGADFQADVVSFIKTHNSLNHGSSFKNLQTPRPTYPVPSFPALPSNQANSGPVTTTRPLPSVSYPSQKPAAPASSPSNVPSTSVKPPSLSYGAPSAKPITSSYESPQKPLGAGTFSLTNAAPAYPKATEPTRQPTASSQASSDYSPPPPPPLISVTVSSSTPQTTTGALPPTASPPTISTSGFRPAVQALPAVSPRPPPQLPRPATPFVPPIPSSSPQPPRPQFPGVKPQPSQSLPLSTRPVNLRPIPIAYPPTAPKPIQSAPSVSVPSLGTRAVPPTNQILPSQIQQPNAPLLTRGSSRPSSQVVQSALPKSQDVGQNVLVRPVQVYLAYG